MASRLAASLEEHGEVVNENEAQGRCLMCDLKTEPQNLPQSWTKTLTCCRYTLFWELNECLNWFVSTIARRVYARDIPKSMLDYVGYAHISIVKLLIKPDGLFQICVNPIDLGDDPNSGTSGGFLNWVPSRHHACFNTGQWSSMTG